MLLLDIINIKSIPKTNAAWKCLRENISQINVFEIQVVSQLEENALVRHVPSILTDNENLSAMHISFPLTN